MNIYRYQVFFSDGTSEYYHGISAENVRAVFEHNLRDPRVVEAVVPYTEDKEDA
jgi:hypothetical protein|tara:strand:+ start:1533 stop:1694 length:162 start_codon:yes stop_codon:yes gene_type:complete